MKFGRSSAIGTNGRLAIVGRPGPRSRTQTGKYIIVVWEKVIDDPWTIYLVTATKRPAASKENQSVGGDNDEAMHRKIPRTPEALPSPDRERYQRESRR